MSQSPPQPPILDYRRPPPPGKRPTSPLALALVGFLGTATLIGLCFVPGFAAMLGVVAVAFFTSFVLLGFDETRPLALGMLLAFGVGALVLYSICGGHS